MRKLHILLGIVASIFIIFVFLGPGKIAHGAPQAPLQYRIPFVYKQFSATTPQIAFIGADPGHFGSSFLFRINSDGTGIQQLTQNSAPDLLFSWSPDGSHIVLSANWAGNDEVYVINADGSGLVDLTNNPAKDVQPSWSPDSKHILFISDRDGTPQVFTMNVDGSDVTRLTDLGLGCSNPIWSPDGSKIAFDHYTLLYNEREIYTVNPNGSGLLRLTANIYFDTIKGWSPDGTKILFLSNRDQGGADNKQDLYIMNSDGTNPIRLTTMAYIQAATMSPDGNKIAFSDFGEPNVLYLMNPDGSDISRVICNSDVIATYDPAWSPDSKSISFTRQTGNAADYGIWTVTADSASCQHLVTMQASIPEWRPGR